MSLMCLSRSILPSMQYLWMMYHKASYHECDRQRSRPFHHSAPHGSCSWYYSAVTEWAEFIVATEPLVKTLGVERMRTSQATYLRLFVEVIEADCTSSVSIQPRKCLVKRPTRLGLS